MSTPCSVCIHPERRSIDAALREGKSARSVGRQHDLGYNAVNRHRANHLLQAIDESTTDIDLADVADPLSELILALRRRALAGSDAAAREYRLALLAQVDARRAIEPKRNLIDDPEFIEIANKIIAALEPYPEARRAVVAVL